MNLKVYRPRNGSYSPTHHIFTSLSPISVLPFPPFFGRYDVHQSSSEYTFCCEFVPGGDLHTRLRKVKKFEFSETRFYISEVVLMLEYLHEKSIVYRDLKPENLMIDRFGHLKLIDFGFAKKLVPGDRTCTICGTPDYVAPECILGETSGYDVRVDYWALGVLTFELMVGIPPFLGLDTIEKYKVNRVRLVGEAVTFFFLPFFLPSSPFFLFFFLLFFFSSPLFFSTPLFFLLPFFSLSPQNIVGLSYRIPDTMPQSASDFISSLLVLNPQARLGCTGVDDIKGHPFFGDVDWNKVMRKDVRPPFVPSLGKENDCQYFNDISETSISF
eukprot:TRINITY_DN1644_c0_g2_i2.p1 TRINITY_DN1644_c0_g2~~TRINITY_DN1644_c0_g2_i2.p1  ORF type:complete len:328 (+),score=50.06 TRINITY_DN1644_c0_g2_i2:446-1429(+)